MDYVTVAAIISALVQVVKDLGVPGKFLPLVAIIIGIFYSVDANTVLNFQTVMYGVMTGLSAIGAYEGAKAGKTGIIKIKEMVGK